MSERLVIVLDDNHMIDTTVDQWDAYQAAVKAMAPIQCERCGADGQWAFGFLDAMVRGVHTFTPEVFRGHALMGVLANGWGASSPQQKLVTCPGCSTAGDLRRAEQERALADMLHRFGGAGHPATRN